MREEINDNEHRKIIEKINETKSQFCKQVNKINRPLARLMGTLVAQTVKNPPTVQETWVQSLGREDPLEEGVATQSSVLAWRTPWTEKPGGLQSVGLQRHD